MALTVTIVMFSNMTAMAAPRTCKHVFDPHRQTSVYQGRTVLSYYTHTDSNTGVTYKCTTYKVTYLVTVKSVIRNMNIFMRPAGMVMNEEVDV